MVRTKAVTALLMISLTTSAMPAVAETPASTAAANTQPSGAAFKASLERAIVSVAKAAETEDRALTFSGRRADKPVKRSRSSEAGQAMSGGGGGMGVASLVLTLVGTAAGIGATVYMLKQLKQAQESVK